MAVQIGVELGRQQIRAVLAILRGVAVVEIQPGFTIADGHIPISVHDVIGLLQNGETIDTIIPRCFPELTRAQVYECLAYYEDHRGEIDAMVAEQMAEDLK